MRGIGADRSHIRHGEKRLEAAQIVNLSPHESLNVVVEDAQLGRLVTARRATTGCQQSPWASVSANSQANVNVGVGSAVHETRHVLRRDPAISLPHVLVALKCERPFLGSAGTWGVRAKGISQRELEPQ